eukprot:TRINITY_DN45862_c0_g1_i1.p3 TRINITY_DN45862_c0_g1~~TRINITY_DN45862_c0_g1_i1.p3  ORF type:complete len:101 (+),score=10.34 TRINITY_DN45862_c0_g1_i1:144-446(+)
MAITARTGVARGPLILLRPCKIVEHPQPMWDRLWTDDDMAVTHCLSCNGIGCGLCKSKRATIDEAERPEEPAPEPESAAGSCVACGGHGCGLCRSSAAQR